jgi:hypothetical protein
VYLYKITLNNLIMQNVIEPLERTAVNAKNVRITLEVDTARIENNDIDPCCNFGQEDHICNKDFTVDANVGDIITWQGVSSSSKEDEVNIISIQHEDGNDIFSHRRLPGDGNEPGKVVGLVLSLAPAGMEYKYKISFTVKHNSKKRNGIFHIDPKIQVVK